MLGLVALYIGGQVSAHQGSNPRIPGVQSWHIGGPVFRYRGEPDGFWTLAFNVSLGLMGPRPSRADSSAILLYIFSIIDRFWVAPFSLILPLLQSHR